MVNVGGRSKGCSTCRRRRVKCDETRPLCLRCQRAGFECGGPADTTFVEGKIIKSRRSTKDASSSARTNTRKIDSNQDGISLYTPLQTNESEIYLCYTRQYLRRGGPVDLAMDEMQLNPLTTTSILTPTSTHQSQIQIPHQAILSFATILFGSQNKHSSIISKGYTIHGIALQQLNQNLANHHCYTRDEVILAVATLALLEALVPTGPSYYLKHIEGLQRIFELRGASSCSSPKSLLLLKGVRHMLLFASLRTEKASILARAEWKVVLRRDCNEEELEQQDLYDVLADCTVLIAERDHALANPEADAGNRTQQREAVERKALDLVTYLQTWKQRWDDDKGRNSHPEMSQLPPELEEDVNLPFATSVYFPNDHAAAIFMLYNTSLIYILRILASLLLADPTTFSNQSRPTPNDESRQGYNTAERSAALEICRCVPHYSEPLARTHPGSCPIVHWAITTAWVTLGENESPEGRWMTRLLNTGNRKFVAKGLWGN